ncbi:MAG: hypothetical protein GF393_10160 [Armatimonadia bacterium]|nr:hypothetical protein [Armatimonadia bacterium]
MRVMMALMALLICMNAALAVDSLDFSTIGMYGQDFDVLDFTCLKYFPKPDNYDRYVERIEQAHERGQFVLICLYTYDRVTLEGPIEEYQQKTSELLAALPLELVDAVCLSEENIAWNNGLEIQNQLYDHVKSEYPDLTVYQWFTPYDTPHAGVRADGWIIDPYRLNTQDFRKYLMKWLATGLPVINCVNASPSVGHFQSSQDQVDVCREFNVPMFVYAVDDEQGSPYIWMDTDDPRLAQWRGWFYRVREQCHETDTSRLPLSSAQYSYGIPVEVAGNETGAFEYADDFGGQKLIDDATIDGFLNTQWAHLERRLGVKGGSVVTLTWHLWSVFEMRETAVSIAADGAEVGLQYSADGVTWLDGSLGETLGDFAGQNLWVRLNVSAEGEEMAWLDDLSITGRNVLPEEPVVQITPHRRGAFEWVEDFESTRSMHLAQIEGGADLQWSRAKVGIRGQEGKRLQPTLRWHFVADRPIERASVAIESYSHRSLSARNEFGISLDGETPLLTATTSGREDDSGRYVGTIEFDLSENEAFEGATEFWVHATLINGAAVKTNPSNDIREVRVTGQLAAE